MMCKSQVKILSMLSIDKLASAHMDPTAILRLVPPPTPLLAPSAEYPHSKILDFLLLAGENLSHQEGQCFVELAEDQAAQGANE